MARRRGVSAARCVQVLITLLIRDFAEIALFIRDFAEIALLIRDFAEIALLIRDFAEIGIIGRDQWKKSNLHNILCMQLCLV